MKLEAAVKIGRFCGLQTVEECILNMQRHYDIFPYKEVNKEFKELYDEYKEYNEGKLQLDFEAIDKENKELEDKMFEEMEEPTEEEIQELDDFIDSLKNHNYIDT